MTDTVTDLNDIVRLGGTITGSGGSSGPGVATLKVAFNTPLTGAIILTAGFAIGPSNTGPGASDAAIASPPVTVGVTTVVVSGLSTQVEEIPNDTDQYDFNATFYVTNLAGTEIIAVAPPGTSHVAPGGGGGSIDWSTATATAVAGVDLSWDGSAVSSAAGGTFVATMIASGGWD